MLFGTLVYVLLTGQTSWGDYSFGDAVHLDPVVNSESADMNPSVSADGLELYFDSDRSGGRGWTDIWVATRPSVDAEWGSPTNLESNINSNGFEGGPCLSSDGLSLYYYANQGMSLDIWVTRRATSNDRWGAPVNIGPTNYGLKGVPAISFDGLQLFFADHSGGYLPGGFGKNDLWTVVRSTVSDPWGPPVNLGQGVNSAEGDYSPNISVDGLMLFFNSNRSGGLGAHDLWVTRRATTEDDWEAAVNLGPIVNTASGEGGAHISADGHTLYFHSTRPEGRGKQDLWQAPIEPIVDFNGDSKVDIEDLLILIEFWDTDESLCDIGPTPFGDGVVDAKDLKVFAEYMLESEATNDASDSDSVSDISLATITATAISSDSAARGPERTVDGSGLNDLGQHSTEANDMWLSGGGTEPAAQWIQYEFDKAYEIHEMHVWNSNYAVEPFVGVGAKDVHIEISIDGVEWTTLEGATRFNQATGSPDYTANTVVDFGGITARFVRITINSGYGMLWQWGLSEIRFF